MPLGGSTGTGTQSLVTAFNAATMTNSQLNARAKAAREAHAAQFDP
jgi:hypothetical protein